MRSEELHMPAVSRTFVSGEVQLPMRFLGISDPESVQIHTYPPDAGCMHLVEHFIAGGRIHLANTTRLIAKRGNAVKQARIV